MKAWDTNVLIRHLTEDDPKQLAIARAELAKAERRNQGIWLSLVTMIETAWVLSAYDLSKAQTLKALEAVTKDTRFHIEHGSLFSEAIQRSRKKGDLPEHVTSLVAKKSGAGKTQTFDQAVKSFAEFELL